MPWKELIDYKPKQNQLNSIFLFLIILLLLLPIQIQVYGEFTNSFTDSNYFKDFLCIIFSASVVIIFEVVMLIKSKIVDRKFTISNRRFNVIIVMILILVNLIFNFSFNYSTQNEEINDKFDCENIIRYEKKGLEVVIEKCKYINYEVKNHYYGEHVIYTNIPNIDYIKNKAKLEEKTYYCVSYK